MQVFFFKISIFISISSRMYLQIKNNLSSQSTFKSLIIQMKYLFIQIFIQKMTLGPVRGFKRFLLQGFLILHLE
jgi:hypothetical protein